MVFIFFFIISLFSNFSLMNMCYSYNQKNVLCFNRGGRLEIFLPLSWTLKLRPTVGKMFVHPFIHLLIHSLIHPQMLLETTLKPCSALSSMTKELSDPISDLREVSVWGHKGHNSKSLQCIQTRGQGSREEREAKASWKYQRRSHNKGKLG